MSDKERPESDSENDLDYVPGQHDLDSDSSSDNEPEPKRPRNVSPGPTEEDKALKKLAGEELWASFQASIAAQDASPSVTTTVPKMVKIVRRYLFAGEYVSSVEEVLEDSPEANKWPRWSEAGHHVNSVTSLRLSRELCSTPGSSTSANTPRDMSEEVVTAPAPVKKRPGPRKPKTTLSALPSSGSAKAKKLSTLDKSAMDWKAHVSADPSSKDELEAHRRTGGYIEKVEFLRRVEERKDQVAEAGKSGKRRRGG